MSTGTGTRPGSSPKGTTPTPPEPSRRPERDASLRDGASVQDAGSPAPGAGTPRPGAAGPTGMLGLQDVRQPAFGQGIVVSAVVAALVLVLAISAIRDADDTGVPLTETTRPLFWGLAAIVSLVAAVGAQYAERTAARAAAVLGRAQIRDALQTAWTVPVVATVAAILMVATYHNTTMLLVGPAIAFFGVAGGLLSRDLLDDATESTQRTAATIHTLVIHAVAFLALSAIYLNKMTSWISAPAAGIIGGLLVLETLERGGIGRAQRIFYAVLGGGVIAEATIVLNWWPTLGWTGGTVLLVCFYVVAGVLLARTQRSGVQPRDLVEFVAVPAVALLVLAATA